MRYSVSILIILLAWTHIIGQDRREGKVTYITSQHVYVQLSSMKALSEGDTLYIMQGNIDVPALQINTLSSVSSYSSFSNEEVDMNQRMRYTFSMRQQSGKFKDVS